MICVSSSRGSLRRGRILGEERRGAVESRSSESGVAGGIPGAGESEFVTFKLLRFGGKCESESAVDGGDGNDPVDAADLGWNSSRWVVECVGEVNAESVGVLLPALKPEDNAEWK